MKIVQITLLLILAASLNIYSQDFWEKTEGPDTTTILSLAINSNGDIFAGTHLDGVFRSTDNGDSWTNLGIANYDIRSMVISSGGDILVTTDPFGGIFRSSDNGNNWINLGFTHFDKSIAINNSNGYIFVGTGAFGMGRTTDNGTSWPYVNDGFTATKVPALIIDSSGYIFAGTEVNSDSVGSGGVYRSSDNGDHWVQIKTGLTSLDVFSLAIKSVGVIFAGTSGGGVFRSTNNGDNWVQIDQGLTGEGHYVYSLAINPSGDIYAGTADGVFRSTNNGANWVQINQGLTNNAVHSLAINLNGDVFAGTEAGIFRSIPSANIKVFLQGPYSSSTGTMSTTLNANGYIPLTQPYSAAPWNYTGTEAVDTVPAGVVDWILLELRSDSATQVSRRAAFLKSDGSIVDLDGVSDVKLPTITPGNYYVVVRHRNHLAVMTADKVTISLSPPLYDFSIAQTQAYGTNPQFNLAAGVFGLIAGDGNANGGVNIADRNLVWRVQNGTLGYLSGDFDLSSGVNIADRNLKWRVNNGKLTQVPN